MEQQMSKGTAMFLLGALTGAFALAITTPRSGREVRERVKDSIRKARHKTDETIHDIEENLKDARDVAKDRLIGAKDATEGLTASK